MSSSSEVRCWRLAASVKWFSYAVAAFACATGFIFGIGAGLRLGFISSWVDQSGSAASNIAWGAGLIVAAVAVVIRLRHLAVTLGEDTLLIQNMFRMYRIDLSAIVRVSATPSGLYVEYKRDGRSHSLIATAAQGFKNAWIFKTSRTQAIADTISARLPANQAEQDESHNGPTPGGNLAGC